MYLLGMVQELGVPLHVMVDLGALLGPRVFVGLHVCLLDLELLFQGEDFLAILVGLFG